MPCFFKSPLRSPMFVMALFMGMSISANTVSASSASGRVIHDPKIINGIANDLLNGLNEARMEEIFLISGGGRLSIDVVPFRPVNSLNGAISPTHAGELNTFLLAALIQKSQGKFRFHINKPEIDREIAFSRHQRHCSVFPEMPKCSTFASTKTGEHRSSNADIVILGKLVIHRGNGYLSYKAYAPETGVILSATSPRKIQIRFSRSSRAKIKSPPAPSNVDGEYLEPSRWKTFRLQKDLELLGFRPGRINGYLTRQTRHAIKRYQWHHGMDPDGDLSPRLLKHIRKQAVLLPHRSAMEGRWDTDDG